MRWPPSPRAETNNCICPLGEGGGSRTRHGRSHEEQDELCDVIRPGQPKHFFMTHIIRLCYTSAYARIRQLTYVSLRQHTSAYLQALGRLKRIQLLYK